MDIVANIFNYGQFVLSQGDVHQAINYFTKALDIFHSTGGSRLNPSFWAEILFARAESFLLIKQYHMVGSDIKQALTDCPQPVSDLVSFQVLYA
jgi:tetratricopeptide (TPR) repeat protein